LTELARIRGLNEFKLKKGFDAGEDGRLYLGRELFSLFNDLLAAASFFGARTLPFNLLSFSSTVKVTSCSKRVLLYFKVV